MLSDPPSSPADDGSTEFHVGKVRAGHLESFAALYERISPSLAAWVHLRIRGSLREVVEPGDVVQEVWWRAMDAFDRFDEKRSGFRAWIFRIATHVVLEWNRDRQRRMRLDPEALKQRLGALPPVVARQGTTVTQRARLTDSVKELVKMVSGLETEDRSCFVYCGLEGLSTAEAGQLLGLNQEAMMKRWQRLRARLASNPVWREFDLALD